MTDFPDWQDSPQTHATAISKTGVPLLHNGNVLTASTGIVVPPSSLYNPAVFNIAQPSYELNVVASVPAAATIPFVQVILNWFDSVSGTQVGQDVFVIPAGSVANNLVIYGRGPSKGTQAQLQLFNLDPAQNATVAFNLLQSSRIFERDVWNWSPSTFPSTLVPGYTLAALTRDITCLGLLDNITVPASGTKTYLFAQWDGLIQMAGSVNTGTASSLSISVRPQPDNQYAATAVSSSGSGNTINRQFAGARAPLRVDLVNSATTALGVTLGLWAVR